MKRFNIRRITSTVMVGILVYQFGIANIDAKATQWANVYVSELKEDNNLTTYIKKSSFSKNLYNPILKSDYLELLTCSMNPEIVDSIYKQIDTNNISSIKSSLTREQAIVIAGMICGLKSYNGIDFTDKQDISEDAYVYVSAFKEYGIISGYGGKKLKPKNKLTVAEAIVIVNKLVEKGFISSGNVIDYAGNKIGCKDGDALQAKFNKPIGLCDDGKDGIIVVDSFNNLIRRVSNQNVETVSGKLTNNFDQYGIPIGGYINAEMRKAQFNKPQFVARNTNGDILVSDTDNNSIRLISNSKVTSLNKSILAGHKDGKIEMALFNKPSDIVYDNLGNAYVADTMNNCIRYIDFKKGEVSTFVGKPSRSGFKNGPLNNSLFNQPLGLAIDKNGTLYVADSGNQRIRKIEKGIVSTVAGSGNSLLEGTNYIEGGYQDGKKEQARFNFPCGIDINENGVIFVADTANHRIRAITNSAVITIAGNGEAAYLSGLLRASSFNEPSDVLVKGNKIYISDTFNSKIRIINIDTNKKWD